MLFKFTTNCVPPCTPNCTPKGWFQMDTSKMKNPANHTISRVLVRLEKRFVGVEALNRQPQYINYI